MKLSDLLDRQFIDTIDRSETSIGVEIELPIVPFEVGTIPGELSVKICKMLQSMGFVPQKYTNSGKICELADNEHNTVSYETSWNTIEFSLKNKRDLISLYDEYRRLLIPVQNICMENGFFLCGRGINPNYSKMDPSPLDTDILLTKSEYLSKYTLHHDGEIFHALCASVQTHMDARDKASFLKLFRLLRNAYIFDALFFANSVAPDEDFIRNHPALEMLERDTLCYRDEIWKYCGAPNTAMNPAKLETMDDYRNYLRGMKLFVVLKNGKFEAMKPILPDDYCGDSSWTEEMLTCFRVLEPVAPTRRGTLEIRSTCVQPLDAMLEPAAFYTGLAAAGDDAEKAVGRIFEMHFGEISAPQARDMLMRTSNAELRRSMKEEGAELLTIAFSGLEKRGFGEEVLLRPLVERLDNNGWRVPAECMSSDALEQTKQQMKNIKKGCSLSVN